MHVLCLCIFHTGTYKYSRKYLNPERQLNNALLDFMSRVPDSEIWVTYPINKRIFIITVDIFMSNVGSSFLSSITLIEARYLKRSESFNIVTPLSQYN